MNNLLVVLANAAKELPLKQAAHGNGSEDSESQEVRNRSGGKQPPDDDGTSDAVEEFYEKQKVRAGSIFKFFGLMAGGGLVNGAFRAVGGEITEEIIDGLPDWVRGVIDLM